MARSPAGSVTPEVPRARADAGVPGPRAGHAPTPTGAQLQLLVEHSADVVVHSVGGIVRWISPSVADLIGWPAEELIGGTTVHLWHPDDRDAAIALRDEVYAGRVGRGVFRLQARDGHYVWIETTLKPYVDDQGEQGAVGTLRDVTERVLAERARAAAESRFRLLADHASDVVVLFGAERRAAWVAGSVTRTLGWAPADLLGTGLDALVHPDDRAVVRDVEARLFPLGSAPAGTAVEFLVRVRVAGDGHRWMSGTATCVADEGGCPVGVVCGLRDVDELVRMRQRAQGDEARLRATLDSMIDPHVLFEAVRDRSGRIADFVIVEANAAACEFNALAHEQMVGTRLLDMTADRLSGLMPAYRRVVEQGESLILDDFPHPATPPDRGTRWYDIRGVRVDDWLSLTWRDVTARHRAAAELAESERRYRLLVENSSDVMLLLRRGRVSWVSPSLTVSFGWGRDEWLGHAVDEFIHGDDLPIRFDPVDLENGSAPTSMRFRVRDRQGVHHWVDSHAAPHVDEHGRRDGVSAAWRVVDDQVAAELELHRRARFDELTGLLNRAEVLDRLEALAGGGSRAGCAVLFCDVDQFKDVNDEHGHATGDEVLRIVAARVASCIRDVDLAGRLGGDEFLLVLADVADLAEAVELGERVRGAVARPISVGGHSVTVTMSIGVALVGDTEPMHALVARADQAMFVAKRTGRDRVIPIGADGGRAC